MVTERNRFFSTILNTDKAHSTYDYRWAPSAVITGHASLITGAWAPEGAPVAIPYFARVTGSQQEIPINTQKFTISIVSGGAHINGVGPFTPGYNLDGGGYGAGLSSPINVGCTGGLVLLAWEV